MDYGNHKWKAVFVEKEGTGRSTWLRIGTAFINKDESLDVQLDALPVNGKLHIRDYQPPEEAGLDKPEKG